MANRTNTDYKMCCSVLSEELRAQFNIDNLSPIDPFTIARNIPHLSIVLHPLGESISGLCIKQSNYSLIAINSGQTFGRQRFTLSHEFYHLYFDDQAGTIICPVGISPAEASKMNQIEREADSFASFFLLPRLALRNEISSKGISPTCELEDALLCSIIQIEQKYGISRKALLVRLEDEGALSPKQIKWLSSNIKQNARRLGFSTSLYDRSCGTSAKKASGQYIDLISELLANSVISRGKAEQYLADGFRDDIHVVELEGDEIFD